MLQGEGVDARHFSLSLKWLRGDGRELFQMFRVGSSHSRTAAGEVQEVISRGFHRYTQIREAVWFNQICVIRVLSAAGLLHRLCLDDARRQLRGYHTQQLKAC
jgi:hypothetical protein